MENIELLVSVPDQAEPILVAVPQGARILEVIEFVRVHGQSGLVDAEDIFLFLEDRNEALGMDIRLHECGIGHHHRIHAHRCRAIDVTVVFGGTEKSKQFVPSAHVEKVKDWAVEAFKALTETTEYFLTEGQIHLEGKSYLGVLTHHCHLHLALASLELTIHYTVNAEAQIAHERHRTPRLILEKADLDPTKYYLKHGTVSYKDTPDVSIPLHECEEFTAIYSGGGTVS